MAGEDWTIKDVAGVLRGRGGRQPKCCLLIGAGVSKSAGIGIGSDFIGLIRERHEESFERAEAEAALAGKSPSYGLCMAKLTEAQRVDLVREQVEAAQINWAHIGIARLVAAMSVDRILTTNFDALASRACALFNRFPAVYDLAALRDADGSGEVSRFIPSFVSGPAIYHLHGQHTGFLLLNTDELLEDQAVRIEPALQEAVNGRVVIICGYSGANDPLVDRLRKQGGFPHGLIWVRHDEAEPSADVRDKLLDRFHDCHVVRNMGADHFFTALANAMNLPQPDFLTKPFQHMRDVLNTVRPFSDLSSGGVDLIEQARALLEAADAQRRIDSPDQQDIANMMARGLYREVYDQFLGSAADRSESEKELIAYAANMLGIALVEQARGVETAQADPLFAQAIKHYAEALSIKPDLHEALNNWGVALHSQAMKHQGPEVDALLTESGQKLAEALALKPDDHEKLQNAAATLIDRAKIRGGADAEAMLAEAEQMLIEARSHHALAGAYNLACLAAVRGEAEEAAKWLRTAKEEGDLLECEEIRADRAFDTIRNRPEFVQALKDVGC